MLLNKETKQKPTWLKTNISLYTLMLNIVIFMIFLTRKNEPMLIDMKGNWGNKIEINK